MSYIINQHIKVPIKSKEYDIRNKYKTFSINLYTYHNLDKINNILISKNNNVEIFFSYVSDDNNILTYAKEYMSKDGFNVKKIIESIKNTIIEALQFESNQKYELIDNGIQLKNLYDMNSYKSSNDNFDINEKLKSYNIAKFSYFENNFGFKVYI